MAGRGDIKAGRAWIEIAGKNTFSKTLTSALNGAKQQLQSFGSAMSTLGSGLFKVGATAATAFGGIAGAFILPIKSAGDLMETMSKFQSVFGDQSGAMEAWATNWANTVGRAKSDALSGLATFQSFFVGMGEGEASAAAMSQKLQALSVDFASFHNISDGDSQQRFISALSGSGDVLSMYGINIMQAALDTELLAQGFQKSTAGATENQKVLARMAIISRTMGKQGATGDATKTAGSFGNQMKKLQGEAKSAAEAIGQALLPVITPLVTQAASFVKVVAKWVGENQGLVVTIAKVAVAGVAAAGAIMAVGAAFMAGGAVVSGFGAVIGGIATLITGAISVIGGFISVVSAVAVPVIAVSAALAAVGLGIASWIKYTASGQQALGAVSEAATSFAGKVREAIGSIIEFVKPFVEVFRSTIGGIVTAFQAGDLGLAAKIAVTGIQLAFEMGKASILGLWLDLRDRMLGMWDGIVVATAGAVTFISSLWSQLVAAFMATDIAKFLQGEWDRMKIGAGAAFEFILSQAYMLLNALEKVRGLVMTTVKEVSKVAPQIAGAATGQTGVEIGKAGFDFKGMIDKAGQDAQGARERVGDQRNVMREERERGGDDQRNKQQDKIAELNEKLQGLKETAAKQLAEQQQRKQEPVKFAPDGAPLPQPGKGGEAGEAVEEAVKKQSGGVESTFSAAAAIAMGRGGGAGGNPAAEAKAQRERQIQEAKDMKKLLSDVAWGIERLWKESKGWCARVA